MQISAPQNAAPPQKFPLKSGGQAFDPKGAAATKFHPNLSYHPNKSQRFVAPPQNAPQFDAQKPYQFKQGVVPIGKPKMAVNGGPMVQTGVVQQARAPAQFPPTPSTIIKPPRFYSNQSIIVPKSKPNTLPNLTADTDKDCVCEREDAIIICQKCGSELLGRVQQKCLAHPRKIQLMDHQICLNKDCQSIKLVEISMDEGA